LERRASLIVVGSVEEAIELSNLYAPEHLCLLVQDPWSWVDGVQNAGGIFLGETSPEVLGDYVAGPSHVMPTGGTARFASSLGVHHFVKFIPVIALDALSLRRLGPSASCIADAEGLSAHSRAVEMRLERLKEAS
jgi:histidinol dehydrogenase